jgi:hypothetical protein
MSADDQDRWLDALAGRDVDGASREGSALREQIRAQLMEPLAVAAEIDPAREAQLIARARAVGLLPAESLISRRAVARSPRRWGVARVALMAAALGGVAIGVNTLRYMRAPPETFRGAANGVVELESQDPRALKQRLIQELKDAGVSATGYDRLDRVGLDADLPLPVAPNVLRVLKQHKIPVPNDGALVVEIRAPGAP